LVACRILQGMAGALMVPVGRLTIVRTFERSELVRAMSFVAIPALIGPMLGPVVGGFIVSYFHWRMIFFVNLPIGLLGLFRVRTFRAAVSGSFITRLGAGGLPFLLPLLYQVGLGFTPVQSGLLMMPQSLAALGMKMSMGRILHRLGYRTVLLWNTILMGSTIALFSAVGAATPVVFVLLLSASFGF